MAASADRRRFLAGLAEEGARNAVHLAPAPLRALLSASASGAEAADPDPPPAPMPARCAEVDELLQMAGDLGLGAHREAVRRLALHSVRLQTARSAGRAASTGGGSWIGGLAAPPRPRRLSRRPRGGGAAERASGIDWPLRDGRPLACIAQIDLAEVAAAMPSTPLPGEGHLAFFFDVAEAPAGISPVSRSAAAVRHLQRPLTAADQPRRQVGLPALPAAELSLPRAFSPLVAELSLEARQVAAWQQLREMLARRQGLPSPEQATQPLLVDRLLGYPDERNVPMALICELAEEGVDLSDGLPLAGPQTSQAEASSARWRLLLQLTATTSLRLGGAAHRRLCFWVADEALRAGDLSGVRAIAL